MNLGTRRISGRGILLASNTSWWRQIPARFAQFTPAARTACRALYRKTSSGERPHGGQAHREPEQNRQHQVKRKVKKPGPQVEVVTAQGETGSCKQKGR